MAPIIFIEKKYSTENKKIKHKNMIKKLNKIKIFFRIETFKLYNI